MSTSNGWVWMRHPGTGGVQRFAAAAAGWWRDGGWEPCDPPAELNLAIGPDHPALASVRDETATAYAAGLHKAVELTRALSDRKQKTGRTSAADKKE